MDIIIIGGHVQALGIIRIMGKLGVDSIILDSTINNLARHSKYCKKFEKFYKGKLLEKLLDMGKSEEYRGAILFPTNDMHVGVLSKNKVRLSSYFKLATDDWSVVEKCYNKRLTYIIAKQLNIPIAETWMPNSLGEIELLSLKYPVIIKPAVMHSFYSKLKKKVFLCNNKEELVDNYKKAVAVIPENEIIVQSVIESNSDGLYSACFLFEKEKEIQCFVGRRARQHPPDFGNATTFAQIVDNEELVESGRKILSEIGYTGICEVEFMLDKVDNTFKFLEINPRTWKWHSITQIANINILENYVNLLLKKPIVVDSKLQKATFRHIVTDIPTILRYKLNNIYKKYPKYPTQYAVWDTKDIKPFIFELINLPLNIFKR